MELNDAQKKMLTESRVASVATIDADGYPHLTSVWFLYQNEKLYLAIPSGSVKARNLNGNARLAVMIDIRVAYEECGVTAIGDANIITGDAAGPIVETLHRKYLTEQGMADPAVGPVFNAIDDYAIELTPKRWISWNMGALDQMAFGGAITSNRYLQDIAP